MRNAEIILAALGLIGLTLSLLLIPGGNILSVLSLSLLSMLYSLFGFAIFNGLRFRNIASKGAFKDVKAIHIIAGVATGLAVSVAIMGLLFRAMRWPGASVMLIEGMVFVGIITFVAALKFFSRKSDKYHFILVRVAVVFVLSLVFYLFGTDIFVKFKYRNFPEFVQAYEKAEQDPGNEALWQEVDRHDPGRAPEEMGE